MSTQFIAGEDIKAGFVVKIGPDGLIYYLRDEDRSAEITTYRLNQDVSKGDTIDYQPGSPLTEKAWAVIHDGGASCDLTHQEAQQMLLALRESGCKGLTIVSNTVGKMAQEKGFLRTPEQN